jgi:phosphoribosylaminoimidazole-succinocarboxamide synthase
MPENFVDQISERYIELYENIIGEKFERGDINNVPARIEGNIKKALQSLS